MTKRFGIPRFFNSSIPFAICVILALSWLAFRGCNLPALTPEQRAKESATLEEMQRRWDEERQEREQRRPFDLALYIISRLAALVLVVGAGAGLLTTLTLKGWAWACQIRPTGGLFPVILSKAGGQWQIHDPNKQVGATTRLGDGAALVAPGWEIAQLATTAGAQKVQAIQAQSYNVQVTSNAPALATAAESAQAVVMNWPHTVPLNAILRAQGGASIHNVVWGMTLNPETGQQEVVKESIDTLCHIGVGGSSGWGKSRFVEMLTYQLLTARENIDVAMIDLKNEHVGFNQANLLWPVATTPEAAKAIFGELSQELDRRLALMNGALSLDEYNARRGSEPELNRLALVADECTALFRTGDKGLAGGIQRLALLGRSAGLLLILAGQNWKVGNAGGSETRDQLSSRCQFKANSPSQSRLLVDCPDAASLNAQGRAVVIIPGRERFEMQAALIGRDEIEQTLTGQTGPRNPAPVADVTPVKHGFKPAVLSPNEEMYILELGEQGLSTTAIQKEVWGENGKSGPRALAVDLLLGRKDEN